MTCKYCGSKLEQGSAFCTNCGSPAGREEFCQMCGEPMSAGESFCTKCGAAAGAAYAAAQQEETPYVPEQKAKPSCPICGAAVQPGNPFCTACGAAVASGTAPAKKKGNKALTTVLIILLVLVIGVAAYIGWELLRDREEGGSRESVEITSRNEPEQEEYSEEEPEEVEAEETNQTRLYVVVVDEDGAAEYYQVVTEEEKLVDALSDLVRFQKAGGKTVIASVLGVKADAENGDAWLLYSNGEELTGDLSRYTVEDGDEIELIYEVGQEEAEETGEYLLPESNSRYLTVEDIEHLDREHLCFARNEIYARHGWKFSVPQIAAYFEAKSWYIGTTLPANFNYGVLNEYEQANVKLIVDYEARFGGSYY